MSLTLKRPSIGRDHVMQNQQLRHVVLLAVLLLLDVTISRSMSSTDDKTASSSSLRGRTANNQKQQQQQQQHLADYTGHIVIRTTPTNESHLEFLSSINGHSVDFWRKPSVVKRSVDLRLSPDQIHSVSAALEEAGLNYDVIADNLQRLLDDEKRGRSSDELTVIEPEHLNLSTYNTYNNIMRWLDFMCDSSRNASLLSPCETFSIGQTSEGRQLKVVKLGSSDDRKPAVWIDAGIHAREWIAPATALALINKLLDRNDRFSRYLLQHYRWYILPVANPDGYVYTWTTDRLWRKNRSRNPDTRIRCRGADLNRNWNYHWSGPGASPKPCREDFTGHGAFSEPETRAMSDFIMSLQTTAAAAAGGGGGEAREGLVVYLSLHSYGQYWLTPWGYTLRLPTDYRDMVNLGSLAVDAIRRTSGRRYTIGPSSHLMYVAAGGSDDWAKAVAGVRYSFTVELRDSGQQGFLLSPSHIDDTGLEMFSAVKALAVGIQREQRRKLQRVQRSVKTPPLPPPAAAAAAAAAAAT